MCLNNRKPGYLESVSDEILRVSLDKDFGSALQVENDNFEDNTK